MAWMSPKSGGSHVIAISPSPPTLHGAVVIAAAF
jgi:hypothetical protein